MRRRATSPPSGPSGLPKASWRCLTVVTAGFIQMLAAAMRLGRLIRLVPFPVVSGFTHGIAISLLIAFTPLLLGIAEVPRIGLPKFDVWHCGAPIVGAVAIVAIVLAWKLMGSGSRT